MPLCRKDELSVKKHKKNHPHLILKSACSTKLCNHHFNNIFSHMKSCHSKLRSHDFWREHPPAPLPLWDVECCRRIIQKLWQVAVTYPPPSPTHTQTSHPPLFHECWMIDRASSGFSFFSHAGSCSSTAKMIQLTSFTFYLWLWLCQLKTDFLGISLNSLSSVFAAPLGHMGRLSLSQPSHSQNNLAFTIPLKLIGFSEKEWEIGPDWNEPFIYFLSFYPERV